ncbi:hypothetical protein ACFL0U_03005, partial [Pseudomonadota bacterium]
EIKDRHVEFGLVVAEYYLNTVGRFTQEGKIGKTVISCLDSIVKSQERGFKESLKRIQSSQVPEVEVLCDALEVLNGLHMGSEEYIQNRDYSSIYSSKVDAQFTISKTNGVLIFALPQKVFPKLQGERLDLFKQRLAQEVGGKIQDKLRDFQPKLHNGLCCLL